MNGAWKPPFSTDEILRAHRLLMSEEQARELASFWEHPPEEVGEDPGVVLMHGSYLALWLLGGETAERVDADYLLDLSTEDRAAFEAEAEQLRGWLRNEGKL